MAVYNAVPYLKEAFRSLRIQSIGFDRVQVILVDDGSTDGSGKICDALARRHPKNVISLHQQNAGPSRARNLGMEQATGKYLNFMDSDDRMTPETLASVAAFFACHEAETDVVAVPTRYFDAEEGEHWQNGRFAQGDRVIDLRNEFNFLQAAANSAFFVREHVKDVHFQEGLSYAEDTRYTLTCLAGRETIGLVKNGCYEYRRRTSGSSLTQQVGQHPLWKTKWMDQYEFWALDYFQRSDGTLPKWVQYALLCHLGNRVNVDSIRGGTREDQAYTARIREVAARIDVEVYRAADEVKPGVRRLLRSLTFPEMEIRLRAVEGSWELIQGEDQFCRTDTIPVRINRIGVQNDVWEAEGIVDLIPGMKEESFHLYQNSQGNTGEVFLKRAEEIDLSWNGYKIQEAYLLRAGDTVTQGQPSKISFFLQFGEEKSSICGTLLPGDQLPVLPIPRSSGWTRGWKYIVSAEGIYLIPCSGFFERLKREAGWQMTLIRRKQFRAIGQRIEYHALKRIGRQPKWINQAEGQTMDQLKPGLKLNADLLF